MTHLSPSIDYQFAPGDMMSTQLSVDSNPLESRKDRIMTDFKGVVTDTETLLKDMADSTAEEFGTVRAKVGDHLDEAKSGMKNFTSQLGEQAKNAASATQGYVREHPWQAIGVAAAAAALTASYFLKRR